MGYGNTHGAGRAPDFARCVIIELRQRERGNAVKGSEAAHPKSVTDIKARIDAEAKMPPEMKARYKAQAENSAKP